MLNQRVKKYFGNPVAIHLRIVAIGMALQFVLGGCLLKFPLVNRAFMQVNRAVEALQAATGAGTAFVFGFLGGAEGLGVSANIFVGMVEAPLLVRPYVAKMTRSQLFTLMTSGMATIAGTVMVIYASILSPVIPNVMGHILIASIISAPAAIVISKIMVPETGSVTGGVLTAPVTAAGAMDAVTQGTLQGLELLLNIIAMIIVLVSLVHLTNLFLGLFPDLFGAPVTLQRGLGWVLSPITWLMGIPWKEAGTAGSLMGTKTILNELIAYVDMHHLPEGTLSPKSLLIMSYALCGFANPGSLGIMIGGMGAMAPERRNDIVDLGFRSLVAGTLATCMTGAVAGLLQFL